MEKTLIIDGKEVRFKSNAATPIRYKTQFGKDFFAELIKMGSIETDPSALDFEVFYNIAWTMAKTADPHIPDPVTWLDQFEEFPIIDIISELKDMIISTMQSKKK
jgi:hypothetical protein